MCDDQTNILLAQIVSSLGDKDNYESGGHFSVQGGTGSYLITSPWNTECEWALFDASANTGTGIIAISASNPALTNMTTGVATYGLSSGGTENNAFEGLVIPVSATQNHIPFEYWQPLGRGKVINISITMSGGNAFVTISFRRKSVKYLPQLPSLKPATHTPLSGYKTRTFYGGFDESLPGRMGVPINPKPEQDTALFKREASPSFRPVSRADHNPMAELDRKVSRRS